MLIQTILVVKSWPAAGTYYLPVFNRFAGMKRSGLFLLLLLPLFSTGQNLLLNGGFEEVNICTEFIQECAPEAWISSANTMYNYTKEAAKAHSGVCCMTIEAGRYNKPFARTILRSRLLCGLRKGSRYQLRFFIRSFDRLLDSTGICFNATDPLFNKTPVQQQVPSFYLLQAGVSSANQNQSTGWQEVQWEYTANGEEAYISIGYFARRGYGNKPFSTKEDRYLVYVDDISLRPLDPNEGICAGSEKAAEEIYEENERHQLLEKKIKRYSGQPPAPPQLSRTTYTAIDTLVLPDILFASGKAVLQPSSFPLLDTMLARLATKQVDSIVIKGHTDNTGTPARNQQLSEDRAKAAAHYLLSHAGSKNLIVHTYGFADKTPLADNNTTGGRQKNRRVELFFYIRE